jgi:hypothetical protein
VGNRRFEGVVLGHQGNVRLEQGQPAHACACYEQTLDALREVGDQWLTGLFLGGLGAAQASLGDVTASLAAFDAADAHLQATGDPVYQGAVALHRGHLDLAWWRQAKAAGDGARATACRQAAQARVTQAETLGTAATPSLATQSDEVRFALRVLKQALDQHP